MNELLITPCTPSQRQSGWDEMFEHNGRAMPGTFDMHPASDIYALSAKSAQVVPVYWNDGEKRGVDWWLSVQENQTSFGSSIFQPEEVWEKFTTADQIKERLNEWVWSLSCVARRDAQLASMTKAQEDWVDGGDSDPVAIVPHAHIWMDWGWERYAPGLITGAKAVARYTLDVAGQWEPTPQPRPRSGQI